MLIDFSDIEEKPLEHFKGGEGTFFARMFTDPKVKIMRGRLEHGSPDTSLNRCMTFCTVSK